jgi:hypothetical protein
MSTVPLPPNHPSRLRWEHLTRLVREAEREVLAAHADEVQEALQWRLVAYARTLMRRSNG